MKTRNAVVMLVVVATGALTGAEKEKAGESKEHISALVTKGKGAPVVLQDKESISTRATFTPPVEIVISAKTAGDDLRIGYAADQVIFNWEKSRQELRVDGGPANGRHKPGAGLIPTNKYVSIKWIVTPTRQQIFVGDQLRYEHEGDYSKINNPVSVFCLRSKVTVQSIKVKPLPEGG